MNLAPQELRTFFVTFNTWGRRSIFNATPLTCLLLDVLRTNRTQHRFEIHAFVIMPNHVHLILTPAPDVSLEKAIQYIKGGFSFRVKQELAKNLEVWQQGFNEHRIIDLRDFETHLRYIRMNPVRAGLGDWQYVSDIHPEMVDPVPTWLDRG